MLSDIAELVSYCRAHQPPGLVSADAWSCLDAIGSHAPACFYLGGLEIRLGEGSDSNQVDFQCAARVADGGRAGAGGWLPDGQSPGAWCDVDGLWHAWNDPNSLLFDLVTNVWLEFDAVGGAPPVPFSFVGVKPHWSGDPRDLQLSPEILDRLLKDAVPAMLNGKTIDDTVGSLASRCHNALPTAACVDHWGVLATRGLSTLRARVTLPVEGVAQYLEDLSWCGDSKGLVDELEDLGSYRSHVSLQLDVGKELGPAIGFEFYYPELPTSGERWPRLFDGLIERGLCTQERRDAVGQWPTPPGEEACERDFLRATRRLLVKVIYTGNRSSQAKAYLGAIPTVNFGSLLAGASE